MILIRRRSNVILRFSIRCHNNNNNSRRTAVKSSQVKSIQLRSCINFIILVVLPVCLLLQYSTVPVAKGKFLVRRWFYPIGIGTSVTSEQATRQNKRCWLCMCRYELPRSQIIARTKKSRKRRCVTIINILVWEVRLKKWMGFRYLHG